jgi:hypothetical protein
MTGAVHSDRDQRLTRITEHKRNATTSTRQCGRRSAEVAEHPRLLFRHGCVGYRGESGPSTVKKNGRGEVALGHKSSENPSKQLFRGWSEYYGVETRTGGNLDQVGKGSKETHASYMPAPTISKGRTIPPGPPVPSSLDSSLCIARAHLFFREGGDVLGDMRDIRIKS